MLKAQKTFLYLYMLSFLFLLSFIVAAVVGDKCEQLEFNCNRNGNGNGVCNISSSDRKCIPGCCHDNSSGA